MPSPTDPQELANGLTPEEQRRADRGEVWKLARTIAIFTWPMKRRLFLMLFLTAVRMLSLSAVVILLNHAIGALMPSAGERRVGYFAVLIAGMLIFQILGAVAQYLGDEVQRWFLQGVEV